MIFSSCCYEENSTTVSRATTKRLAFSCSSCYNYEPIPLRAIEHVTSSVNHLQAGWLALICSLCLFLAHACVQMGAFRGKFFWFYLLFTLCLFLCYWRALSPFYLHNISFSEVSNTDAVFSSLSTPTKRSFDSGMSKLYHYSLHFLCGSCYSRHRSEAWTSLHWHQMGRWI